MSAAVGGGDNPVAEAPPTVSCSNGIAVDTTAPTAGAVFAGYPSAHALAQSAGDLTDGAVFQTVSSELVVRWAGFADVDENDPEAPHDSGIAKFALSIGSHPGAADT